MLVVWFRRVVLVLTMFLTFNVCLQPLMLIVPDVQDVYTPLQTDVLVPLSEVNIEGFHFLSFLVLLLSLFCFTTKVLLF